MPQLGFCFLSYPCYHKAFAHACRAKIQSRTGAHPAYLVRPGRCMQHHVSAQSYRKRSSRLPWLLPETSKTPFPGCITSTSGNSFQPCLCSQTNAFSLLAFMACFSSRRVQEDLTVPPPIMQILLRDTRAGTSVILTVQRRLQGIQKICGFGGCRACWLRPVMLIASPMYP